MPRKKLGVAAADIHLGGDASETTVKRAARSDYSIVYCSADGLVAGDVEGFTGPSLASALWCGLCVAIEILPGRAPTVITAYGRAVMTGECHNTRQALRRINDPALE